MFTIRLQQAKPDEHILETPAAPDVVPERIGPVPEEDAAEIPAVGLLEITEKSLLVVDDSAELRQYLVKMFSDKYVVYEAADGNAGWKLAQRHVPDVIISDVLMDGLSGFELCRNIKQEPSLGHIPVILLSGLSQPGNKLKGIECGAEDYFIKPFDQELLAARIRTILENRNALQQYFRDNIALQENHQKYPPRTRNFLKSV